MPPIDYDIDDRSYNCYNLKFSKHFRKIKLWSYFPSHFGIEVQRVIVRELLTKVTAVTLTIDIGCFHLTLKYYTVSNSSSFKVSINEDHVLKCFCSPSDFFGGRVKLTNWTRFSASRLVNGKNVYFAEFSGHKVVVKKLAHDSGKDC